MASITRDVVTIALLSRFLVVVLQFITNIIIPDHKANAFVSPKFNSTSSFADSLVNMVFAGFVRWDGQYFVHIAKYGYTYENMLAFFPLYPIVLSLCGKFFATIVVLNEETTMLVVFVLVNTIFFVKSAVILLQLSRVILKKDNLSFVSVLLFCFNPASIFFMAPYTECLFSYLTFKSMLNCFIIYEKHDKPYDLLKSGTLLYLLPIALGTCTRSNGILNIGFLVYCLVKLHLKYYGLHRNIHNILVVFSTLGIIIFLCILCFLPFVLVQIHGYKLFCTNFIYDIPEFLVQYGQNNNLVFPGSVQKFNQSWCFQKVPFAYSYIQKHYWNVGFFNYFELKQLPNFILASPIIYICSYHCIKFFRQHTNYCLYLGMVNKQYGNVKEIIPRNAYNSEMFVFVVHNIFLTFFCVFCIHVQVTTRILLSASPVPYWYLSYYFNNYKYSNIQTIPKLYSAFKRCTAPQRWILYYFISYFVIGITMFCNFLPWT